MRYVIPADKGIDSPTLGESARERLSEFVMNLDRSIPWSVEVKRYRKGKTSEQLGYYHGVIVATFCEETGAEHDDMHEYLLGQYFGWNEYEVLGRKKVKPVRTLTSPGKIAREDFSRFIDWCIAFAAKKGLLIPLPNEVLDD